MIIQFKGLPSELADGMDKFLLRYANDVDTRLNVNISFSEEKRLVIKRDGENVDIQVAENVNIYRAMSQIIVNIANSKYSFDNEIYFGFNGVMLDFSQANAFLSVDSVKELLMIFAALGLSKFMLYVEDCIEVPGEDYFGYMRPKYSKDELRQIDDYAYALGIEVIPCIQSLAHLPCLIKWDDYRVMSDNEKTFLVGDERVYTLVKKVITAIMEPLRTKTVHIGLDEAWNLGQGKYLIENGYRPKMDIFAEHLKRVKEITDSLGYYPMIWNDMYFRANANEEYYLPKEVDITLSEKNMPPEGIGYVYWDYYNDEDYVTCNIKKHQKLFDDLYFAGACSTGTSLAFKREFSVGRSNGALMACKKDGLRKVFCTVWGDDIRETPPFSVLNGIIPYSEHCYNYEPDDATTEKMFKFAVGLNIDDFNVISDIDIIEKYNAENKNVEGYSPSRHLLYQDVMCGLMDKNFEQCDLETHFMNISERMQKAYDNAVKSNCATMFSDMFKFYSKVSSFLAIKGNLGIRIHKAYNSNDIDELKKIAYVDIPEALRRGEEYISAYRDMFFKNFKALGFEIFDIRNGGVIARLKTAKVRIENYLNGTGDLDELNEEQLLFDRKTGVGYELYKKYVSPSFI